MAEQQPMAWRAHARVRKWDTDEDFAMGLEPAEVLDVPGNLLLSGGVEKVLKLIAGVTGVTAYNAANTRIGVGDGTTAAAPAQNSLLGTNKLYKVLDSGYPVVTTNGEGQLVAVYRATYQGSEANFAWQEWGLDSGTASGSTVSGVQLNRKVEYLGVKVAGTWQLTVELTLN